MLLEMYEPVLAVKFIISLLFVITDLKAGRCWVRTVIKKAYCFVFSLSNFDLVGIVESLKSPLIFKFEQLFSDNL